MNDLLLQDAKGRAVRHWREANTLAASAVEEAWSCGEALNRVKTSLNHGEWLPWLVSVQIERTKAERWMRLARELTIHQAVEFGSIDTALKALPRVHPPKQPDEHATTQDGEIAQVAQDREGKNHPPAEAPPSFSEQDPIPKPESQPKKRSPLEKERDTLLTENLQLKRKIDRLEESLAQAQTKIEALELEGMTVGNQGARLTELSETIRTLEASVNKWMHDCTEEKQQRIAMQRALKRKDQELVTTRRALEMAQERVQALEGGCDG